MGGTTPTRPHTWLADTTTGADPSPTPYHHQTNTPPLYFIYITGTPKPCKLGESTTAEMCPLQYGGDGGGCQPPNLINTLISIALSPGSVVEPMFGGQATLQVRVLGAFCGGCGVCGGWGSGG